MDHPYKVILFANTDWYLYNFRLPLAKALRSLGYDVILVSPPGSYADRLSRAGFRWVSFEFRRFGLNPISELRTLVALMRLYRNERPDLVHHFTIKCVLYGSIAARIVGVRSVVNAVTGLGYVFVDERWQARLMRPIVRVLYRLALGTSQVIFQNRDDQRRFREGRLVPDDQAHLVRGSGVDTSRFFPAEGRQTGEKRTVLFASRLLRAKGIYEFLAATARLRVKFSNVEFCVAGDVELDNPDSVTTKTLDQWRSEGKVKCLGHRDDMDVFLRKVDVVVLPSYREGVPRILVEAAASGLPLVATDVPGCREIVRHGENGILVPVKDIPALAGAMETLLRDDDLCRRMGEKSREIACAEFNIDRVILETFQVYAAAGADVSRPTKDIGRSAKFG